MGSFNCSWARFTVLAFALTPITAFALPGEANAVLQHCGQPSAQDQQLSPVTGQMQRSFTYNDVVLRFEPAEGGWSFTNAWNGHRPLSRSALEARMPCFRDAVQQIAAAPAPVIDPTIAAQTTLPTPPATAFGIPFLWIIFGLAAVLAISMALPSTRRRFVRRGTSQRFFRKPSLARFSFRRRPPAIPKPTDI
jgi:hypothetical protein